VSGEASNERLNTLVSLLFQAHPWHGIAAESTTPGVYNGFVEIVPTDTVKYELDKASGHLRIDRPQRFSSLCPLPYGFIPQTYCGPRVADRCAEVVNEPGLQGDGDPLDICIVTEKGHGHGNFLARIVPVGGLRMLDGNEVDDKIVAVLEGDVVYGQVRDLPALPAGLIERLKHYFLVYKQKPGETAARVRIAQVYGQAEALAVISRSREDYRERFGPPESRLDELRRLLTAP
jgi:inorganic pyrophosphatase